MNVHFLEKELLCRKHVKVKVSFLPSLLCPDALVVMYHLSLLRCLTPTHGRFSKWGNNLLRKETLATLTPDRPRTS